MMTVLRVMRYVMLKLIHYLVLKLRKMSTKMTLVLVDDESIREGRPLLPTVLNEIFLPKYKQPINMIVTVHSSAMHPIMQNQPTNQLTN
mmetsp:Transcript_5913/g.8291  ORF Transcript_5913/g.8291 Transcript_5913/m.8291 type:complete len:89 (-) Transcript_5913:673-939(-)